jgi:aspartate dehydrogenase
MKAGRLKIGIIGCGTIGTEIGRACLSRLKNKVTLFAVCDIDEARAERMNKILRAHARVLKLDDIIKKCDFIVEAASARISAGVLKKCVKHKKACLVMSVGGLLGKEGLLKAARSAGAKVYIPSGAVCGIDGLKAASIGNIDTVTLTTRKPPKGLEGAPYLKENNVDPMSVKKETVVFDGTAAEAVLGFPKNINVSAVLSLAGIGAKKTFVKIVTSPDYTLNTHEVEITGEFGRIVTKAENRPSRSNPKTSALAVFSAIAALEGAVDSVRIGT